MAKQPIGNSMALAQWFTGGQQINKVEDKFLREEHLNKCYQATEVAVGGYLFKVSTRRAVMKGMKNWKRVWAESALREFRLRGPFAVPFGFRVGGELLVRWMMENHAACLGAICLLPGQVTRPVRRSKRAAKPVY